MAKKCCQKRAEGPSHRANMGMDGENGGKDAVAVEGRQKKVLDNLNAVQYNESKTERRSNRGVGKEERDGADGREECVGRAGLSGARADRGGHLRPHRGKRGRGAGRHHPGHCRPGRGGGGAEGDEGQKNLLAFALTASLQAAFLAGEELEGMLGYPLDTFDGRARFVGDLVALLTGGLREGGQGK